jgi:hypothetical protein
MLVQFRSRSTSGAKISAMAQELDEDLSSDPTNPAQTVVLQATEQFLKRGTWPLFSDLKREAARRRGKLERSAFAQLQELGLTEMGTTSNDEVVLNVTGLARCGPGRAFLASYLEVVTLCVAKYLGHDELRLSNADLVARSYATTLINRLDTLLSRDGALFVGRRETDAIGWSYTILERIEEYRVVTNLRELLVVRALSVASKSRTLASNSQVSIAGIDTY